MAEGEDAQPGLSKLFLLGWKAKSKLDAFELSTGTPEHSSCVAGGISALERATQLASHVSLLSDNEDLDELPTSSLKYLLLPALLGELTLQQTTGERTAIIGKARVYFVDFLRRCRNYGVTKEDPPPMEPPMSDPLVGGASKGSSKKKTYNQLAAEREVKIRRLKEKKELERRTEELTAILNRGGGGGGGGGGEEEEEEEGRREHWVAMLQLNVYKCRDSVQSIDDEMFILKHLEAIKNGEEEPVAKQPEAASGCGQPRPQPVKPIVITREMLRGKVFGAGYPSVPTMTVEEFHQQRYAEQQAQAHTKEEERGEEEAKKEEEEDEDSEEVVKKAREWDEFKDDNRRGWGNKKNMG